MSSDVNEIQQSGDEELVENDVETDVVRRHRKEKKELQALITSMKHKVSKSDRSKKKEIADEIARLETELANKHARELEQLQKERSTNENNEAKIEEAVVTDPFQQNGENVEDLKRMKISKAQKRRDKKEFKAKETDRLIAESAEEAKHGVKYKEEQSFKTLLSSKGLMLHEVSPNGDCLFNALGHQLSLSGLSVQTKELRERAASVMQNDPDNYLPFLTNQDGDALSPNDFDDYCAKLLKPGVWGGQPELVALSNFYRRPIEVLQADAAPVIIGEQFIGHASPLVITNILDMAQRKMTKSEFFSMEVAAERKLAKFIRENFFCKECKLFVPKVQITPTKKKAAVNSVPFCYCGGTSDEHTNLEKMPMGSQQWSEESCIEKLPTNAYGRIRFTSLDFASSQRTKYVRLADDTDPKMAMDFMTDYWRMVEDDIEKPQLIISVVGGGRRFQLAESVQKKLFNRELMRAVATTNGWLLTSGLDAGVAHAVGDSLREAQSFVWRDELGKFKNKIFCIGIVPWGAVFNCNRLINGNSEMMSNVSYPVFSAFAQLRFKTRLPLNPYHTHFFLVDDGYRNRERGVAEFRAKLEKQFSESVENGGLGVPVVQILIDGSANALEIVARSVSEGVPVLVCEGSGRAADLLAEVCRLYGRICKTADESERASKLAAFEHTLQSRIRSALYANHTPVDANERFERCLRDILQICEKRHMVTIFNIKRGSALDTAILASLMDRTSNTDRSSQLRLALKWNQIDVAKAKIFGPSAPTDSLDLWPFFMEALITNKPEFVQLFMEFGLDVKSSLTVQELTRLYQATIEPTTLLWRLLKLDSAKVKTNPTSLLDIYKIVKMLVRRFDQPLYSSEKQVDELLTKTFEEPFDELFLWSVLLNNETLATRFWEYCDEPLVTALAGTLVCHGLASWGKTVNGALKDQQVALQGKLEALAISLAEKAYATNVEQTMLLLHRRWKKWGNFTCMELAAMAKNQEFLSSEPCQYAISKTWTSGYDANGWTIAICAFTILPVMFVIQFDEYAGRKTIPKDIRGSVASIARPNRRGSTAPTIVSLVPELVDGMLTVRNWSQVGENGGGRRFTFNGSDESLHSVSPNNSGINIWRKYVTFYRSPSVKFALHTLSYLAFLILYAYVILFAYRPYMTTAEIVLYAWLTTLFFEQARLLLAHPSDSLKEKSEEWLMYSSMAVWHRLDLLMLILAFLAFILRWFPTTFNAARLILASNYITCLFRLFKIYFVNSYLGPKVVMLKRMAFDLAMFLLVLIIILLSYTVVSHALLFPHHDFYVGIFWNLLYHGVWVLFGEVQSELDRISMPACASANSSIYDEMSHTSTTGCATYKFPPPILLAAYCFFGNILLVNMLIATFTNVFEKVQKNSKHLWKYLMYFVLVEYVDKPALPPPFIVIEHVYILLKHFRRCAALGRKGPDLVWGRVLTPKNYRFMNVFEKTIRSDLVEEKQQNVEKRLEKLIPELHDKVHRIFSLLKSMKSEMAATQTVVRKKKGAFTPSVITDVAAKILAPISAFGMSGMIRPGMGIVPDSYNRTPDDDKDDGFPIIDESETMAGGARQDYYDFEDEATDEDENEDILERIQ